MFNFHLWRAMCNRKKTIFLPFLLDIDYLLDSVIVDLRGQAIDQVLFCLEVWFQRTFPIATEEGICRWHVIDLNLMINNNKNIKWRTKNNETIRIGSKQQKRVTTYTTSPLRLFLSSLCLSSILLVFSH